MSTPTEDRQAQYQALRERKKATEDRHLAVLRQQVEQIVAEMDKLKGPLSVLIPLTELQMHNTDVENPHALRLLHETFEALLANITTVQFGVRQSMTAFEALKSMEDYEEMMKEMKEACGFDLTLIIDKIEKVGTQMNVEFERFTTMKSALPEIVK